MKAQNLTISLRQAIYLRDLGVNKKTSYFGWYQITDNSYEVYPKEFVYDYKFIADAYTLYELKLMRNNYRSNPKYEVIEILHSINRDLISPYDINENINYWNEDNIEL